MGSEEIDASLENAARDAAVEIVDAESMAPAAKKAKRLCRFPGCTRVIKSQGHCQRHGAKAKRCRVDGCEKQAQGTHDGMCKRHWKSIHFPDEPAKSDHPPPPPEGESVYDHVLPQSIAYRPNGIGKVTKDSEDGGSDGSRAEAWDPPAAPEGINLMPLVAFLRENASKEAGWHRNAERRARGLFPVSTLSVQLEPWERQLALVEILLLSGGTPYASFKDLAHAWGRERGFHHVLANAVCERRGEVERKRRSDAGKTKSSEEKESFRHKLNKTRARNGNTAVDNGFTSSQDDHDGEDDDDDDEDDDDDDDELDRSNHNQGVVYSEQMTSKSQANDH